MVWQRVRTDGFIARHILNMGPEWAFGAPPPQEGGVCPTDRPQCFQADGRRQQQLAGVHRMRFYATH